MKYIPHDYQATSFILGCPPLPSEFVHHINGDKRPENLRVFSSQAEHKENDKEVMPNEVHPTRISAEGDKQDRQQ